jgi:hypothetical protein
MRGPLPNLSSINDAYQNEKFVFRRREKKMPEEETFPDPAFWQALGLALRRRDAEECTACDAGEGKCHWHGFIDHIATGKSPQSFFESLP